MLSVILILSIVLFLAGFASYLVSNLVYKRLTRTANPSANLLRWVTMVACFIIIMGSLFVLFIYDVSLER